MVTGGGHGSSGRDTYFRRHLARLRPQDTRVVFVVVRTGGSITDDRGDIAIDNIAIHLGQCGMSPKILRKRKRKPGHFYIQFYEFIMCSCKVKCVIDETEMHPYKS